MVEIPLTKQQAEMLIRIEAKLLDPPPPSDYIDRVPEKHRLENTKTYMFTHHKDKCAGQYCVIHNMSDHSMRNFPQQFRYDRYLMERICPHGIGHPDPDDPKASDRYESSHGCDGCCAGAYRE